MGVRLLAAVTRAEVDGLARPWPGGWLPFPSAAAAGAGPGCSPAPGPAACWEDSRYRLSPARVARSCRPPTRARTGASSRSGQVNRASHDHRSRVPAPAARTERPAELGLSHPRGRGQPGWPLEAGVLDGHLGEPAPGPDRRAELGALPPGVTFADRTMCGLQAGSFRWPAAKPETTSAGAPVTISPVILVMPGLTPARRDAG